MNYSRLISNELIRILLLPGASLFLSALFGHFWMILSISFALYLAWHIGNLLKLGKWLQDARAEPPQSTGSWEHVFNQLYRNQKLNKAEKKRLKRQIDRFEESATALPDATVILDKNDNIEWCNEAAERLLGLHRKQDYGQRIDNLIRNPRFIEYLESMDYDDIIEMPSPIEENITLRVRLVIYGKKRKLMLARNISRLHNLELMRRDFIANVSHELRTPLTVITGFIENMHDSPSSCASEWSRPLTLMQEQSARMLNIIDDLLFLSRLETESTSRKKDTVNVPALLRSIQEDAINYSGIYNHNIETDIDPKLYLKGDQQELHSAFSNLVINAVKYTPQGGNIKIRWFHNNQGGVFEVQDDGIGIPTPHLSRLTERFYRVDVGRSREQGGTGLGLAIVKHVLIRHNAKLTIRSEENRGSTFTCVFPDSLCILQESGSGT